MIANKMNSEIIIYNTEDGLTQVQLQMEGGTVWLSQAEIANLFQTTKQNVSKHIKAIFEDGELREEATVNYQLTVQKEGERKVSREIAKYNLDMILAVGYRVRSIRGAEFRRYASTLLKENAIEQREMRMTDYVRELDTILASTGRKVLDNAGKISNLQATEKAKLEYKKYKNQMLSTVEQEYLETISALEKKAKNKGIRN